MMRLSIFTLAFLTLAACERAPEEQASPSAPPVAEADDSTTLAREVRAAADRYFVVLATGDEAALDSELHANHVGVYANGAVRAPEERLADHREGRMRLREAEYEILAIQPYGDDFALVQIRGRSEGDISGRPLTGAILIMGYARSGNAPWEQVYFQAVPVADTPFPM